MVPEGTSAAVLLPPGDEAPQAGGVTVVSSGWFGVRCVFEHESDDAEHSYEERVTLWQAGSFDEAIALAEAEATEYAGMLGRTRHLGLAQAYALADEPGQGAEGFSLIRDSGLAPGGVPRRLLRHRHRVPAVSAGARPDRPHDGRPAGAAGHRRDFSRRWELGGGLVRS